MRLSKLSSSTKVTDEQKRLSKVQAGLHRQKQELEKTLLLEAKKEQERKREQERKKVKINVTAAASQAPFSMPRSGKSSYSQKGKPRLAREVHNDKVKFLFLCIVFAAILVMLWRAIPS